MYLQKLNWLIRKRTIVIITLILGALVLTGSLASDQIPKDAISIGKNFYRDRSDIWGEMGDKGFNFVYKSDYKAYKVSGADADSFKVLDDKCLYYGKDKNHAFYSSFIIEGADSATFECLQRGYTKDAQRVYYEGKPILTADVGSFKVLTDTYHAMDINRVYFSGQETLAATSSFELLLGQNLNQSIPFYGRDSYNVYNKGERVEFADPSSFQIVDDHHAKDDANVWWNLRTHIVRIPNADPESFKIFGTSTPFVKYAKDKNRVYVYGSSTELDASSFELISNDVVKDQNGVYCFEGKNIFIFDQVDPKTFQILNDSYAKDNQRVFYYNCKFEGFYARVIDGADASTFIVTDDGYAKDRNRAYKKDKVVNLE